MTNSTIFAFAAAFIVTAVLVPLMIPYLKKLKFGQTVREEGPESHKVKTGTPTMGGVAIMAAVFVAYLAFIEKNIVSAITMTVIAGFGAVGFIDDYIKVVKKRNLGLRAWQKLSGQLLFALVLVVYQYVFTDMGGGIYIPLVEKYLNMGIFYIPFAMIVVLGIVNSVNLTDGLDGLASGVTLIFMVFFVLISFVIGSRLQSVATLVSFASAVAGGCIGFLIYNKYPAKVFMGDVGSLALGGAVSALMVLSGAMIVFPILGAVFLAETLSVVIQVVSFKTRGKRVFLMSPLHHHYEEKGWKETKVVTRFYLAAAVSGLFAVAVVFI
ncbi:Phospho-N-acetylmuramoyl-pentapeptide-transferase [Dethiosulfatibacter aminovorans DSM 17477]|uniref:Phospho-N-acetylmuramoyl-pentapeptide-transferase n=1 Tax=Dethiosulfatibacter aminovorans DSM 17477 TaxID=1121476 RepID=A0A1M6DLJ3_9FIRM|nr:phospho-N-acetylmuramoyl-pentapeptide-transferase [Dethiosulfatibacter aminovorans]SHI74013.1 Phospho-N-acetylmuramoyl-pentapeptide-transferase [Dethiosulfatibacter aminovorans DSM 17477]